MLDLRDMTETALAEWAAELGEPAYRGRQIFRWLQQKLATSWDEMSDLPRGLRGRLSLLGTPFVPELLRQERSAAGDTVKSLLKLADGACIETVLMLYAREKTRDRVSVCVSSHSGCGMGCAFCATARCGAGRKLSAGEMVSQVLAAEAWCREAHYPSGVTNVVYMGMGEPLLNLDAVLRSIEILNSPNGLKIGMRRMTVSTCGLPPQMAELAERAPQLGLAISLHAPNNALRSRLMPVNERYPLEQLIPAAQDYSRRTGRRVTYEYALFRDVNDSNALAVELGKLLKGELCQLNLIPANPVPETDFFPSRPERIAEFVEIVRSFGIETELREARGKDIAAACGQLRRRMDQEQSNACLKNTKGAGQ